MVKERMLNALQVKNRQDVHFKQSLTNIVLKATARTIKQKKKKGLGRIKVIHINEEEIQSFLFLY